MKKFYIIIVLFVFMILSCEGPEGDIGPNGLKSLIKIETELPGPNCASAGLKLKSGIDQNDNNELEDNEVQATQYVCNGVNSEGVNIIRIPIQVAFAWRQATTTWTSETKDQLLFKFNIADYPGFTKAFFIAQFDRSPDNTVDSLYLRLYDYKNQKSIADSEVWSTITNAEFNADPNKRVFQSAEIYDSFEKMESTIGIQFKKQLTVADNREISIHGAEILLLR